MNKSNEKQKKPKKKTPAAKNSTLKVVNCRVEREVYAQLEKIAKRERRSVSSQVALFLERGVYTQEAEAH